MGLRAAVLIAVNLLVSVLYAEAAPPRNHCLACHPVHYAAQGSCASCHRGNQRTSRQDLAHSGMIAGQYASFTDPQSQTVIAGKKLAEQTACRRCHNLGETGNRLASNLDILLWTTAPASIRKALTEPALYMPDFHFTDQDLDRLVTVILAGGLLQSGKVPKEPPVVVHFSDSTTNVQNVFVKQCGGCHKILSKRDGGLGTGIAGPNLSGLLTRFYPPTFEDTKPWDKERLKRWLKNPREIRKNTLMRPVPLKPEEWDQLLQIL